MRKAVIILFLSLLAYAANGQTCIPDNDSGVEINECSLHFTYGNAMINPMYTFHVRHLLEYKTFEPLKFYIYDTVKHKPLNPSYFTSQNAPSYNTCIVHMSDTAVWMLLADNHMGLETLEIIIGNMKLFPNTDLASFLRGTKAACKARISDITIVERH